MSGAPGPADGRLPLLFKGMAGLLLPLLLLLLYRDAVSPAFAYMGFVYFPPAAQLVMLALLVSVVQAVLLPTTMRMPSDLFAWLFYLLVVVPSLVLPLVSAAQMPLLLYLVMVLTMTVALLLLTYFPHLPIYVSSRLSLSAQSFWKLAMGLLACCTVLLLLEYRAGLGRLLSLSSYQDIYRLRFSFREQGHAVSALAPYLLLWSSKVLIPLLFAWSVMRRHWLLALSAVVLQVLMFSISGHKSFLLSLVLVGGVLWLWPRRYSGVLLLYAILGMVLLSGLLFYWLDSSLLVNAVTRRMLMVPGMLSGFYFEYFHNHGLALYAQNFLSGWTDSVYTRPPAFEIGYRYFGREETSSNAHFWADAFANMGYFAVIVVTLIMAVLLTLINALARSRDHMLVLALFIVPFWTLMESSLNTTLISHGMLLAVLLAFAVPLAGDAVRPASGERLG